MLGTELTLSTEAGRLELEPMGMTVLAPSVVVVLQVYAVSDTGFVEASGVKVAVSRTITALLLFNGVIAQKLGTRFDVE